MEDAYTKKGALNNVDTLKIDQVELKNITNLYEHKGKDFYYKERLKNEMDGVTIDVVLRNCKTVMDMRKINISDSRFRSIVKGKSKPKNKDENMVENVAFICDTFAKHIKEFDLNANQFLNLGKLLFKNIKPIKFRSYTTKEQENLLMVEKKHNTRDILTSMLIKYESLIRSNKYETVSVVSSFFIDYMMEEIFDDENEFIGIFILYALLFKQGFELFKFTSFLEEVDNKYDLLKDALAKSEHGWYEGYPNACHFTSVLRRIMIDCYQKIDTLMHAKEIIKANQKTDMIELTILKRVPDVFTKEMIKDLCPDASQTTIDRTLKRLREENKIIPNGTGRSAKWTRIYKEQSFNKNEIGRLKQFTLADYVPEAERDSDK